jgi:hypothetical protein
VLTEWYGLIPYMKHMTISLQKVKSLEQQTSRNVRVITNKIYRHFLYAISEPTCRKWGANYWIITIKNIRNKYDIN